ncbi:hypothetical protein G4D82_14075 [Flavobacterium sp. CYK-4]|uniref:hypothetical protein n=1 Tax=Flavobacterium lotistagni TaxID=2709660 RepID=UPI00140730D4|nr:hypothetical protein [Flavobacterium lotistagni]NHM07988.1 hypothetical protein [Flavobacterium lotistagni]NHM08352.1 hypothetical protein [Flavobacterium lotistagni]
MENKKGLNFFFLIIAIITGSKLVHHFDFQNFSFQKPAIDTIYLVAFLASIFFLIREFRNRNKD